MQIKRIEKKIENLATRYKIRNPEGVYFITFATINWIDVFTRPVYRHILTDSLSHCVEKKGLIIHAWVLMSNHVHMVCKTEGENLLQDILRDLKKYTSVKIIEAIKEFPESRREWILWMMEMAAKKNSNNTNYQFWQQDNHPVEVTSTAEMETKIEYIHNNPVRAELVANAEEYLYSSAIDYSNGKGIVNVEIA